MKKQTCLVRILIQVYEKRMSFLARHVCFNFNKFIQDSITVLPEYL